MSSADIIVENTKDHLEENRSNTEDKKQDPPERRRETHIQEKVDLKTEIAAREKRDRRKKLAVFVILGLLLAAAGVAGFLVFRFYDNIRSEIRIEAGDALPEARDFLKNPDGPGACETDISAYDTAVPGRYPVVFSWLFLKSTAELVIVDTVAPEGETRDLILKLGEKPKPEDFIVSMKDETEVEVRYILQPDLTKEGDRSVSLVLEDRGGNQTILKANLSIYDETNVPVIKGAENLHIFTGDSVSYRSGVSVISKVDP